MKSIPFSYSLQQAPQSTHKRKEALKQIEHTWGKAIKSLLKFIALEKWGEYRSFFGIIRKKDYRLRFNEGQGTITWWVEHDIPPYDLYRCEAYRVTARIEKRGNKPQIYVESSTESLLLNRPSLEGVKYAVTRMAAQPPLHIPRRMGQAWD